MPGGPGREFRVMDCASEPKRANLPVSEPGILPRVTKGFEMFAFSTVFTFSYDQKEKKIDIPICYMSMFFSRSSVIFSGLRYGIVAIKFQT